MHIGIHIASQYNVVTNRTDCYPTESNMHVQFDTTMCDIFRLFRSEERASVVTRKVKRSFYLEGSFNETNHFIFNQSGTCI